MPVIRPYRRTWRPMADGTYFCDYIDDPRFAKSPEHYIRGFLMLLRDMQHLFDYIEPCDSNKDCYSLRTHELLLRACIEVEANCKAIFRENGCVEEITKKGRPRYWNMEDYRKIEASHRLSAYEVRFPVWSGSESNRHPFASWAHGKPLEWYEAYNACKHDRHDAFQKATFRNMLEAISGLCVLLSAQFHQRDFSPSGAGLLVHDLNDGFEQAIGDYLRIKFPTSWAMDERYDFDWVLLKQQPDPFQNFDFKGLIVDGCGHLVRLKSSES